MYPKRVFVWDALRRGIPVLPPDILESGLGWTPTARGVRAGLDLVKGLRRALLRQILAERQVQPFRDLHDLRRRVRFHTGELERLILLGACRAWGTREKLVAAGGDTGQHERQLQLFAAEQPVLPDLMASELALTDIPFARHPVESFAPGICRAAEMPYFIDRPVTMLGILDAWKITRAREKSGREREMSFATLEDATGIFELVLFPDAHARFAPHFRTLGPYRVHGVVRCQWDSLNLEMDAMEMTTSATPRSPAA
jgi:DNA polymerase III alpha subunit